MTIKSHETHVSLNGKLTKLFLVSIIAILFVLANPYSSHAANIGVTVDGVPVSFDSSTGYPFLDKANRTLVPLRAAMEACGCTVDWDESNGIATITKDSNVVKIVIGQNCIYRNNKMIENDSAAVVINGRTYLPIRAVLESFYFSVGWDNTTNTVTANSTLETSNSVKPAGYDEFWSNFNIKEVTEELLPGKTILHIVCVYNIEDEASLKNFLLINGEQLSNYCKTYLELNQKELTDYGSSFLFRIPSVKLRVCEVSCSSNPTRSDWESLKLTPHFIDYNN